MFETLLTPLTLMPKTMLMIRPVTCEDTALVADLFQRLSPLTTELRFMIPRPLSEAEAWSQSVRVTQHAPDRQTAFLVTHWQGEVEEAIAVAEYVRDAPGSERAEIGIVVRDDFQRQGVGTELLSQMMQQARTSGIMTAHAYLMPANEGVRRLVRRLGVPVTSQTRRGLTEMEFSLAA